MVTSYAKCICGSPHARAVGSTFEYDFPVITHNLYGSAKPDGSKQRRTSSNSRPAETEPAPQPKCPDTPKPKGTTFTPGQRKEQDRANRAPKGTRHLPGLQEPRRTRQDSLLRLRREAQQASSLTLSRAARLKPNFSDPYLNYTTLICFWLDSLSMWPPYINHQKERGW